MTIVIVNRNSREKDITRGHAMQFTKIKNTSSAYARAQIQVNLSLENYHYTDSTKYNCELA